MPVATGPAIRGVCRVVNQSSCGSGSICGLWEGGSLVLTNAHVAGTQIGRKVAVEIESRNMRRLTGVVIAAAYSRDVIADWALVHVPGFQEIEPVYLSKNPPAASESMYTKGFPQCRPHNGTDIMQHKLLSNGVLLWVPDAIGGQSGSGVWGDDDHLQKALLTWSWGDGRRMYGAGQPTAMIYRQNRNWQGAAMPRSTMPGLIELPGEYDFEGINRIGLTDPVVEETYGLTGIETGIVKYPIWAEDIVKPEPPVAPEPGVDGWKARGIEFMRGVHEKIGDEIDAWEKATTKPIDPDPNIIDDTFGL